MTKTNEKWTKVKIDAIPWKPAKDGEELIGIYLGDETIDGDDGPFESHRIQLADERVMGLTGTTLVDQFTRVPLNAKVRVVFMGMEKSKKRNREYKTFSVFVAEGVNLLELNRNRNARGDLDSQAATA